MYVIVYRTPPRWQNTCAIFLLFTLSHNCSREIIIFFLTFFSTVPYCDNSVADKTMVDLLRYDRSCIAIYLKELQLLSRALYPQKNRMKCEIPLEFRSRKLTSIEWCQLITDAKYKYTTELNVSIQIMIDFLIIDRGQFLIIAWSLRPQ